MNRLGFLAIVVFLSGLLTVYLIKSNRQFSSFSISECVCDVDNSLTIDYQKKITEAIKNFYKKNNDPQEVIQETLNHFPEISDMKAEICGADAICFNIQSLRPLFILEGAGVVVDKGIILEQQKFDQDLLIRLPKIDSKALDQVADMILFTENLPIDIFKNYDVEWKDKNYIVLRSKKYKEMRCLVSQSLIPKEKLLQECLSLYELSLAKIPKKKQKNHMVEYDIRFKNQIIVRSGGNYG